RIAMIFFMGYSRKAVTRVRQQRGFSHLPDYPGGDLLFCWAKRSTQQVSSSFRRRKQSQLFTES
ncbi:MAG TPA: hypothetical protein VGE74_01210, partial [Gemmata sp.]